MSDFERVFEIGPVFRAEKTYTHRHLCEFTGLDAEMSIKESYLEIIELISKLFIFIFKGIEQNCGKELVFINDQFPFQPFELSEKPVVIDFREGVGLLNEHGIDQKLNDDLSTPTEKILGKLVKEKYHTDFYILHRYP